MMINYFSCDDDDNDDDDNDDNDDDNDDEGFILNLLGYVLSYLI